MKNDILTTEPVYVNGKPWGSTQELAEDMRELLCVLKRGHDKPITTKRGACMFLQEADKVLSGVLSRNDKKMIQSILVKLG